MTRTGHNAARKRGKGNVMEREYPKTKPGKCQFCGADLVLERRGTRPAYWYTHSHDCEQRREAARKMVRITRTS